MTEHRLYRADQYLTHNTAVITEIREKNGCDEFICDFSVFYPEGGGQPSDTGTVSLGGQLYEVIRASASSPESEVWHETNAPAGTFTTGDQVELAIDWDLRFRNMQRHLGEHMLSGTMETLFGGVNKGFHMGADYITIDIDLGGRYLTEEELDLAEMTVNEAVWADLPVEIRWFDDYEASLVMPVRKQVPHEGRVSIVTVGDPSDPYDCIACCGTHPASSAEVGLVALYKSEPNKGMNRIYFDCGKCAFDKLAADSRMLSDIAKRYSCSPAVLPDRLDTEAENISALKARLASLSSYVKDAERARILEAISGSPDPVYVYSSDILSTDDLLKLGFSVAAESPGRLIAMLSPESLTCLLFSSGEFKCGKLIKDNAQRFGGRGGGRDDNARAIFANLHDLKSFASSLPEMI